MAARDLIIGATYPTGKNGNVVILEKLQSENKRTMVKVQFVDTGTIKTFRSDMVLSGVIKDPYRPNYCGVACMGEPPHYTQQELSVWKHMIERCYDKNNKSYQYYGGRGITVCDRWKCFEYFVQDIMFLDGYKDFYNSNDNSYQLDKDYLQKDIPVNQRVYSPMTCRFVYGDDNNRIANIDARQAKEHSTPYYGVYQTQYGTYQSVIILDGQKHFLGTYSNVEAAANVYNYVAARCFDIPTLNKTVPFMDLDEALTYLTGRTLPDFPSNIDISFLKNYVTPCSSPYLGVSIKPNTRTGVNGYQVAFYYNGTKTVIGTFSNEIAAANAYNYACMMHNMAIPNQVPYMPTWEWLQYKNRAKNMPAPVEMCHIAQPKIEMCTIVK